MGNVFHCLFVIKTIAVVTSIFSLLNSLLFISLLSSLLNSPLPEQLRHEAIRQSDKNKHVPEMGDEGT